MSLSSDTCHIEGCVGGVRGWGLCSTHWLRWKTHGDPYWVTPWDERRTTRTHWVCTVDGCEGTHKAHGFCGKHLRRWRKSGDPLVVGAISGRPLKGSQPSWSAIHKRLERQRGGASRYLCIDCHGEAAEWSYDGTDPNPLVGNPQTGSLPYSLDLERYVPRCVRCHRQHDRLGMVTVVEALQ